MLQAFFDESSDGKTFLLGGWVAEHSQWSSFAKSWNKQLAANRAIQFFSHHEAKKRSGQFAGWTANEIESKMEDLVDVICQHEMFGIVAGLNLNTHAEVFKPSILNDKHLRSILKITHPYQWCFFAATAAALQTQLNRDVPNNIDFIFDEQTGLFGACAEMYTEFKNRWMPPELHAIAGAVNEADDKDCAELQAADLLVGQLTTNLKIGKPEPTLQKLARCHQIEYVPAYPPAFESLRTQVRALNVIWATKRLSEIAAKGLDSSENVTSAARNSA